MKKDVVINVGGIIAFALVVAMWAALILNAPERYQSYEFDDEFAKVTDVATVRRMHADAPIWSAPWFAAKRRLETLVREACERSTSEDEVRQLFLSVAKNLNAHDACLERLEELELASVLKELNALQ